MADTWGKVEKNKDKDTNKDAVTLEQIKKDMNKIFKSYLRVGWPKGKKGTKP